MEGQIPFIFLALGLLFCLYFTRISCFNTSMSSNTEVVQVCHIHPGLLYRPMGIAHSLPASTFFGVQINLRQEELQSCLYLFL